MCIQCTWSVLVRPEESGRFSFCSCLLKQVPAGAQGAQVKHMSLCLGWQCPYYWMSSVSVGAFTPKEAAYALFFKERCNRVGKIWSVKLCRLSSLLTLELGETGAGHGSWLQCKAMYFRVTLYLQWVNIELFMVSRTSWADRSSEICLLKKKKKLKTCQIQQDGCIKANEL